MNYVPISSWEHVSYNRSSLGVWANDISTKGNLTLFVSASFMMVFLSLDDAIIEGGIVLKINVYIANIHWN